VRANGNRTPPDHLRDGSYRGAKALGRGVGYVYPHAHGGFAAGQSHLPDALAGRRFYEPTDHGFEARLAELLEDLRRRRGDRGTVESS
jgi:putative ATPase